MRQGMTFAALRAALIAITTSASIAYGSDQAIQTHCAAEWPGDADMRAYCVGEQRKAVATLARYSGPIRKRCEGEWSPDFEMILHCVKEQTAAQSAVADAPQDEITARCAREWPSEYDMQEHCAKERRAAFATIERTYAGAANRGACESEWGTEYDMVLYCLEEE